MAIKLYDLAFNWKYVRMSYMLIMAYHMILI